MRRRPGSILFLVALSAVAVPTWTTPLPAEDSTKPVDLPLPATYRATMMILDQLPKGTVKMSGGAEGSGAGGGIVVGGGPVIGIGTTNGAGGAPAPNSVGTFPNPGKGGRPIGNSAYLSMTLRRFTTDDESLKQEAALKAGGTSSLVAELEKSNVGALQLDNELPWVIRSATTWTTSSDRVVRLITTGRLFSPKRGAGPDASPIVNIVEFHLKSGERYGEGTLVSAIQVDFAAPGRIVPVTLVIDSGTQRLTNVEPRPVKNEG